MDWSVVFVVVMVGVKDVLVLWMLLLDCLLYILLWVCVYFNVCYMKSGSLDCSLGSKKIVPLATWSPFGILPCFSLHFANLNVLLLKPLSKGFSRLGTSKRHNSLASPNRITTLSNFIIMVGRFFRSHILRRIEHRGLREKSPSCSIADFFRNRNAST